MTRRPNGRSQRGTMLAELVVALAVLSILAGGLAVALTSAFQAQADVRARSTRALEVEQALRRLQRDVRRSVPESLRLVDPQTVELLHLADSGRYRSADGSGPAGFTHNDVSMTPGLALTEINILGRFLHLQAGAGGLLPEGHQIAVVSGTVANAGDLATVSAPDNRIRLIDDGDEDRLRLDRPHVFPGHSPGYQLYLADGWMRYHCVGDVLYREFAPSLSTPADPRAAGRVIGQVQGCGFDIALRADGKRVLGLNLLLDGGDGARSQQLVQQSLAINLP